MGSDLNQFVLATDPTDADLAGRLLVKDPAVNAGVLELLAALGIRPDQIRRTA